MEHLGSLRAVGGAAPAIESTLRAVDADVIALQEVWETTRRNQAAELARTLGYTDHVFGANLERDGVRAGNAIVSRWPITRREVHMLPRAAGDARDDEGEERIVVFAEIDGPRGPIQVYCVHLSWSDDHSAVRQAQVAEICRIVRERRPRTFPAVLCGDLNADPGSDEIRMLTGHAAVPVAKVVFRDVRGDSRANRCRLHRVEREPVQRGVARPRTPDRLHPGRTRRARRRRSPARCPRRR